MNIRVRGVATTLLVLSALGLRPIEAQYNSSALPKTRDYMIQNYTFASYVNGMDWNTPLPWQTIQRRCNDAFWCTIHTSNASVQIQAVGDANLFDFNTITAPYGVVIGRLMNATNVSHPEGRYRLPPTGEIGYMVVEWTPVPGQVITKGKWILVLVGDDKSAAATDSGTFTACRNSTTHAIRSYGGFKANCDSKGHAQIQAALIELKAAEAALATNGKSAELLKRVAAARAKVADALNDTDPSGPAWFSCLLGCCTADNS